MPLGADLDEAAGPIAGPLQPGCHGLAQDRARPDRKAVCPCWVGEDPDGGSCDAFNAYRVVHIPGNVLAPGSWQVVSFVDDRASAPQFEAILDAYQGRLGGPLADLALAILVACQQLDL